ncbi:hypothetical protein [Deinococcus ruber]|uniref:Phage tail tape measure protein domain-containing protein n=1 Tax=Deinococcus ruber TaxID=1848197 RepID=A0A918CP83_9DEIO|nr:hypothetical protein [Deinococcus ruber]GGR34046.1 hypothetical protein GCM10008957_50310 [Deinococcus ruber]
MAELKDTLSLDVSQYLKQLDAVDKKIDSLYRTRSAPALPPMPSLPTTPTSRGGQSAAQKELTELTNLLKVAQNELKQFGAAASPAQLNGYAQQLASLTTRAQALGPGLATGSNEARRLSGVLLGLEGTSQQVSAALLRLSATPATVKINAPNTAGITAQLAGVTRSADQNARALQSLLNQVTTLGGPLGSMVNQLLSVASGFQGMTAAELAAVGPATVLTATVLAMGAALASSLHEAISFEAALSQLRGITGLSKGDIGDLGDEFQKLATQLPFTSVQLAEIGRNAALAGVHGKEELGQFVEIGAQLGVLLRDVDGHAEDLTGTMRELAKFINAAGISGDKFIPALRISSSELITLKTRIGGTVPPCNSTPASQRMRRNSRTSLSIPRRPDTCPMIPTAAATSPAPTVSSRPPSASRPARMPRRGTRHCGLGISAWVRHQRRA